MRYVAAIFVTAASLPFWPLYRCPWGTGMIHFRWTKHRPALTGREIRLWTSVLFIRIPNRSSVLEKSPSSCSSDRVTSLVIVTMPHSNGSLHHMHTPIAINDTEWNGIVPTQHHHSFQYTQDSTWSVIILISISNLWYVTYCFHRFCCSSLNKLKSFVPSTRWPFWIISLQLDSFLSEIMGGRYAEPDLLFGISSVMVCISCIEVCDGDAKIEC